MNWRRIYDCGALGVELAAGDVLPAPRLHGAALTATDKVGAGDSHEAPLATALVEALAVRRGEEPRLWRQGEGGRRRIQPLGRMFESA